MGIHLTDINRSMDLIFASCPCAYKGVIMNWGSVGTIGGILLAAFLIITGISMLIGGTAIPAWFIGILAVGAGSLILIGR